MQSSRRAVVACQYPRSTYRHSTSSHRALQGTKLLVPAVPHIRARNILDSHEPHHTNEVNRHLQTEGVLKITLGFPDNRSKYLERLVLSLGTHHGHGPPITHSANRGWFWDVRPTKESLGQNYRARSETMDEFPWHTDCSYELASPQFFALQVLQPDFCGGGILSALKVDRIRSLISADAYANLLKPEFEFKIPSEFSKDPATVSILSSILGINARDRSTMMRYREDIITPVTTQAFSALKELKCAIREVELLPNAVLRLGTEDLPERSIILLDNRRWLHARSHVKDPNRHLRRVRWNAAPFSNGSMYHPEE
ncbi:unnamed protein product [Penicillium olsonii]|nr:unnamed protein product [Penicillium olsonii]